MVAVLPQGQQWLAGWLAGSLELHLQPLDLGPKAEAMLPAQLS
jgi:hypothetical protein